MLKLNIADNGNGTAKRSIPEVESGFGTLLVQLLTTQLGGRLEKTTDTGTSTTIYFAQQQKSAA